MMPTQSFSLEQLAAQLGAKLRGEPSLRVSGLASLDKASSSQLSFLAQPKYRAQLASTRAGAVLLRAEDAADCPCACLLVDDPYLAFARVSHLFDDCPPVSIPARRLQRVRR